MSDDLDILAVFDGTATTPATGNGANGRTCRRHSWAFDGTERVCSRCRRPWDADKARKGRNSRRRGNDFERAVAVALGGTRVGMFGHETDVEAGPFALQCKEVESLFPERIWKLVQAIPPSAVRIRGAVLGDVPGAGKKRRTLIVFDFDEWAREYGGRR